MKDLYSENFKTLVKEIEEDTHTHKNWKDNSSSWIKRINIVKMATVVSLSKVPDEIFDACLILKFLGKLSKK